MRTVRENLRPGIASIEWRVLRTFWVGSRGLSLSGVRIALGDELSIESIEVVVAMLVEKGYLRPQPGSSIGRYAPTLTKREVLRIQGLRWSERFELAPDELAVYAEEAASVAETAGRFAANRPAV